MGWSSGLSGRDVESEFVIDLLLAARLWEPTDDGGYRVHDYPDYQPTRESLKTDREQLSSKRAAAGSKGGLAKASKNGLAKSSKTNTNPSKPLANGWQNPSPVPGINTLGNAGGHAGRLSPETVPESGDYPGARAREDDPLGILDRPSIGHRFDQGDGQAGKPASPSKNSRKKTTEHEGAVR
jgi:hypothetical protein